MIFARLGELLYNICMPEKGPQLPANPATPEEGPGKSILKLLPFLAIPTAITVGMHFYNESNPTTLPNPMVIEKSELDLSNVQRYLHMLKNTAEKGSYRISPVIGQTYTAYKDTTGNYVFEHTVGSTEERKTTDSKTLVIRPDGTVVDYRSSSGGKITKFALEGEGVNEGLRVTQIEGKDPAKDPEKFKQQIETLQESIILFLEGFVENIDNTIGPKDLI